MNEIHDIPLEQLHPHPLNANVMSAQNLQKLARHIQQTGRYEPLVVRPHPDHPDPHGEFQLINGHHRARVLKSLGHTHALCLVWKLTDAQTLLLLSTVNRLSGEDQPSKRLALLESLALQMPEADLARLLPESSETIQRLLRRPAPTAPAAPPRLEHMPEAFTVFLSRQIKRELIAALKSTHENLAAALEIWMRSKNEER